MTDKLARVKLARAAKKLSADGGLPALVLMTDDERLADPLAAVRALSRGSMVIVRARQRVHRAKLAAQLRVVTRARGIKMLVANDESIARRYGADGIHLAQANARQAAHWRALHPGWIITAAAHALATCHVAYADALIVGPVFTTASHPGSRALGAVALRNIARQSRRPVYALGGIDVARAARLDGARLVGLAAIGALAV